MADDPKQSKDDKDKAKDEAPAVEYAPSTAQVDAERRAEERKKAGENDEPTTVAHRLGVNPSYGVEEGGGYIGTDPMYQNAADDRQRPFSDEKDWQRSLLVEPAEDAGQLTLPFVPEHQPGAPRVQESGPTTSTGTVNSTTKPTPAKAAGRPGQKN